MSGDKPVCLLCRNVVSVVKTADLQRHYTSLHGDFDKNYPAGSKVCEDKVTSVKRNLQGQQNTFQHFMNASDLVTEASLRVSWVLAKKSKKTFTDGETVKQCFLERADSLFAEFPNKREIQKQISHLQLSHQTVAR